MSPAKKGPPSSTSDRRPTARRAKRATLSGKSDDIHSSVNCGCQVAPEDLATEYRHCFPEEDFERAIHASRLARGLRLQTRTRKCFVDIAKDRLGTAHKEAAVFDYGFARQLLAEITSGLLRFFRKSVGYAFFRQHDQDSANDDG